MQEHNQNNFFPAAEFNAPPIQSPSNLPHRILLVDHDPYLCHLSADVLIRHGYQVNAAENGEAGWEELQANHYSLLITEHDLPKMSGFKLVRKVRDAHLALPVVMIARKFPMRKLARNPSLQLAATLLKPLPVDALLDTVKIVLRATDSPGDPSVRLSCPHNESTGDGWRIKLIAVAASATTQIRQEINNGYDAYPHWGLNE